jgi:hypothetical protein
MCWLAACELGCSEGSGSAKKSDCDQKCQDNSALRALRETVKLIYNLTLQAKPVGVQDERVDCPQGGRAHVFGTATSNALQGATQVELTYELEACAYLQRDDDAEENYDITLHGTLTQRGTIAVQPSATTALLLQSDALSLSGTVHDPQIPYSQAGCVAQLTQNGNRLSGMLCGRAVGVDL